MGAGSGVYANKKIYVTYDHGSKDVKIQGFTTSLMKLCNNVQCNCVENINESDIVIHLISQSTIKHHKQLDEINQSVDKISILIYLDRKVPISASNNITNNVKSISVSYKDYEDFQDISKVIITKLIES